MTSSAQPRKGKSSSIYIAQGEQAVSNEPGVVISTILASCVATCLWDPSARIGGMNHFLLPDGPVMGTGMSAFGANAMELFINNMIKKGAERSRLRAKVFGGAEMYRGLTKAGAENGQFVLKYLEMEQIPCDGKSLGGDQARRIEFFAAEGRARQRLVSEAPIETFAESSSPESSIDLF